VDIGASANLEVVDKFCYLGDMLSVDGDAKRNTDWVKKCMEYEVEGSRPRGRRKRTWREMYKKLPSIQFEQAGCYGSW